MIVYLTSELSWAVDSQFKPIFPYTPILKEYFIDKFYGEDLTTLYIHMICESGNFSALAKSRKPKYKAEKTRYMYQGVEVERDGKSLSYDVILNYDEYKNTEDIKAILARDILASLQTIKTVKKIQDFDVEKFKADFELFFKENSWI